MIFGVPKCVTGKLESTLLNYCQYFDIAFFADFEVSETVQSRKVYCAEDTTIDSMLWEVARGELPISISNVFNVSYDRIGQRTIEEFDFAPVVLVLLFFNRSPKTSLVNWLLTSYPPLPKSMLKFYIICKIPHPLFPGFYSLRIECRMGKQYRRYYLQRYDGKWHRSWRKLNFPLVAELSIHPWITNAEPVENGYAWQRGGIRVQEPFCQAHLRHLPSKSLSILLISSEDLSITIHSIFSFWYFHVRLIVYLLLSQRNYRRNVSLIIL